MKLIMHGGNSRSKETRFIYVINLIALISTLVILFSYILLSLVKHVDIRLSVASSNFWLPGIAVLLLVAAFFMKPALVKVIHVLLSAGASVLSILDQYNNPYGILFWVMAIVLCYRYGFFRTRALIKSLFFCLYLFVSIESSAITKGKAGVGIGILFFLIMFMTIIYVSYKEELKEILFYKKKSEYKIQHVLKEKKQLEEEISEKLVELDQLKLRIEEFKQAKQPLDLDMFGLTEREQNIINILVQTKGSNREIADHFEISEGTVKQHLYNIFNKIGVDDRYHLIDLCRYNFQENESLRE